MNLKTVGASAEKDNYGNLIAILPPKGSKVNEPFYFLVMPIP